MCMGRLYLLPSQHTICHVRNHQLSATASQHCTTSRLCYAPGMGWIEVLKQSLDIRSIWRSPGRSSSSFSSLPARTVDPRELGFTTNALKKMGQWHLSEADVKDVFFMAVSLSNT